MRSPTITKLLYYTLLCVAVGFTGAAVAQPAVTNQKEIPQSLWQALSKARHQIEAAESGYHAFNPGNHQRYDFQADGLLVKPAKDAGWQFGLKLSGFGTADNIQPVKPARILTQGQRIEYQRGNLSEWYQNKTVGLEQGFTVHQPPMEDDNTLVIAMTIQGGLSPRWQEQGQSLTFHQPDGSYALSYNKLVVEDANQQRLPAHLELKGNKLQIHVETVGAVYPVVIDPLVMNEQKVYPLVNDGAEQDNFGYSVALSGDTALIGAFGDDDNGFGAGSAYVFVRSGATWLSQAKLIASDASGDAFFGWSVALSGDTAVVAANRDDSNGTNSGAAYVFTRSGTTWTEQAKLTASDGVTGHSLGHSVALAGDTILLGAHNDNGNGIHSGAAYVFTRSGTSWTEQAKLAASDGSEGDLFGWSVALSGDTALLGARRDADKGSLSGSAYVFIRSGTNWSEQAKLTASDGAAYDLFGSSVALLGNTALVGANQDDDNGLNSGSVYVFARVKSTWSERSKLTPSSRSKEEFFGKSIALSGGIGIGSTLIALIGTDRLDATGDRFGKAYLFTLDNKVWTEQTWLTASDELAYNAFGRSMALSGNTALIGAAGDNENGSSAGAAYIFSLADYSQQAKILASIRDKEGGNRFGSSVAISGDIALIGAHLDSDNGTSAGAAYIFTHAAGIWSEQTKLLASDGSAGDYFGSSVALSGGLALIGAYKDEDNGAQSGSAYLFAYSASTWTEQTKLTPSDGVAYDRFGRSVALGWDHTTDTNLALVGADGDDENGNESGSVYSFIHSGTTWSEEEKVTASDGAELDSFGLSIATSFDMLLIGAPGEDGSGGGNGNGNDSGSAYIFKRSSLGWGEEKKLSASDGAPDDRFGKSVAISHKTALIGAYLHDDKGSNSGSAYVFLYSDDTWNEQAKLTASDGTEDDYFGWSVAISDDTALVGAYGHALYGNNSGSAYLYTRSGTTWAEQTILTSNNAATADMFGFSVALSGEEALVGAYGDDGNGSASGSAYFYTLQTYTISATVSGLTTYNIVLLQCNNDSIFSGLNGLFTCNTPLVDTTNYSLTIWQQPDSSPHQTCTVNNGSGTVAGANVTNIEVICVIDDADNDGMPDDWETQYGLDPFDPLDASEDPDADGLSNLDEYLQGTDPHDSDTDNDGLPDGDDPQPDLPELNICSGDGDHITLSGPISYQSGTLYHCRAPGSVTTDDSITIKSGSGVLYMAPMLKLAPGFRVEHGGIFHGVGADPGDIAP